MIPYRTLIVTLAGLVYLLALAGLAGTLDLPEDVVNNLGYAGTGMVLGLAGKAAYERGMQAKHARSSGPGSDGHVGAHAPESRTPATLAS